MWIFVQIQTIHTKDNLRIWNTTGIHFIRLNRGTKDNLRICEIQQIIMSHDWTMEHAHSKCLCYNNALATLRLPIWYKCFETHIACGSRCFTSASRSAPTYCSHAPPWLQDRKTCKPAARANCHTSCQGTSATSRCSQPLPLSSASTRDAPIWPRAHLIRPTA